MDIREADSLNTLKAIDTRRQACMCTCISVIDLDLKYLMVVTISGFYILTKVINVSSFSGKTVNFLDNRESTPWRCD